MKPQQLSQSLPKIAAGTLLTLVGILVVGSAVKAQQAESTLANGTYLYGEMPQPDQVGKGYVVFAHQNGKVMGAFYYPLSEFDCFAGSMKDNTLEVQSVGVGDPELETVNVNLAEMYQIQPMSESDRRILSSCKEVISTPPNP